MRFYPTRYHSKEYRDNMAAALAWDYTRANILRLKPEKNWGYVKIIGWYADYIMRVNRRKPKK